MKAANIFDGIPADLSNEVFEEILLSAGMRLERILSKGHISPENGWYDQDQDEWVLVLEGMATLEFEEGESVTLSRGDYLNIPAHRKHRVSWTDPDRVTLWLAVFHTRSHPSGEHRYHG